MPEGSASLNQLAVGDRVVYPNQGVCRVTAIDTKVVAGQSLVFVTMRREEDGAVVMVPQAKIVAIGVRKVANAEDVKSVFAFLRSDGDKADLDWKQRARTNLDRMTQGGILGLAEVVKDLQILSELRPLPTKERELYDNARHLLVSEVAAALGTAEVNAEDAIDIVLFPPGRERPKRTAAEFARGEEDDLGLDGDLLGLDGDLDLPSDEEPQAEASESEEETSSEEEGEESEEKSSDEDAPKKRGRPPKAKPAEAEGAEPAAPKKRGRPPKPKPEAPPPGAEAPAPKKRGRPPKAKPPEAEGAEPAAPKKRGRPPKAKPAEGGED
ncbi:transcriptional regulator [Myxococcus sp. CA051A]|uniref:Transcriptional regulator n=1 Tax=Myxococcus llanfairpwllgwyngyllgogerychwyrndrobwllllantysiliogogogochensis TaxID=2590453 RepID=A0A540WTJ5_9BACT|nr:MULTISPECIES: CarD family transcriptional regulator [Myxococcus]NTX00757.1 transcriptional regulator [Myxococcus sp. CA040A]NTX12539.1 transcriptional regulator [Myxococcus sp. CA056]NTX33558.1 transcriptional regulator [Myxococcus sp. CA033]NTX54932.1 transcriptional regulator [Myxococcus sp. CA039A]NTX59335.1 transcriptional regulator [Myxococcus sp. CA051A]